LQTLQVSPWVPQAEVEVPDWQVLPAQQPFGQLFASHGTHFPFWQFSFDLQVMQALPPLPQAASEVPGWQVVLLQQPFEQLCPSQTQAPPEQRWPDWQATQAAPPLPQAWSVGGLMQMSTLQQPLAQLSAPHLVDCGWHLPPLQLWPAGQEVQAWPPLPQATAEVPG
jgi:hypothetical protein